MRKIILNLYIKLRKNYDNKNFIKEIFPKFLFNIYIYNNFKTIIISNN